MAASIYGPARIFQLVLPFPVCILPSFCYFERLLLRKIRSNLSDRDVFPVPITSWILNEASE